MAYVLWWSLPALALANFFPWPLENFAEDKDRRSGVRRFSHSEHHYLEGGTALSLNWKADVDPETILALDSAHQAGVVLVDCTPNSLVLHLPASHISKAKVWKHITASEKMHSCAHIQEHPLYHRVVDVEFTTHAQTPKGGKTAVFRTEELHTASQVLPNLEFSYDVKPINALHPDDQPSALARYENHKRLAAEKLEEEKKEVIESRRLNSFGQGPYGGVYAQIDNASALKGYKQSIGTVSVSNKIKTAANYNLADTAWNPMTHANFGWNWNYKSDAIRNPQFKYKLPGMRGYILLKNPYLKFTGLFYINFTSHWNDVNPFASPPLVRMHTKFEGNAMVNADLGLLTDIYRDVSRDYAESQYHIPLIDKFTKETYYFKKVSFFIGDIPVSLQPGVNVDLNAYHLGMFKGGIRCGINVHLRVSASADFDSAIGIDGHLQADALNVRMLPPTWMIYTKHLEFGALLTPSFWLKGAVGPVRNIAVMLQLRPYVNISITQEGQSAYGAQGAVQEKQLVIFPFRAINLPVGSEWTVGIEANKRRKMTDVQMSLGVAEFANFKHIPHFEFGYINQRNLLHEPIYVSLWKGGVKMYGSAVKVFCEQTVNGECQPAPANAYFQIEGKPVIVQLTMAWRPKAVQYLLSKVRAVSFVFPQLSLGAKPSKELIDDEPEEVFIKITRNGREYKASARYTIIHNHEVVINTRAVQDIGVSFVDAWRVNYGSISNEKQVTKLIDPNIELFYKRRGEEERMAYSLMPPVAWSQITTGVRSNFMGQGAFVGNVPLTLSMAYANDVNKPVFATGRMGLIVDSPGKCNRWIVPRASERFAQGKTYKLLWTLRDAKPGESRNFKFVAWKVDKRTGSFESTTMDTTLENMECKIGKKPAGAGAYLEDQCVFSEDLKVEEGLVGITVIIEISWQDKADGTKHKMLSAPISFVAYVKDIEPFERVRNGWGQGRWQDDEFGRTLSMREEGGNMVSAPPDSKTGVEIPMETVEALNDTALAAEDQSPRRLRRLGYGQSLSPYGAAQVSGIDFNDKMAALHPICTRKPLHYSIGAGIFFRAKVKNLDVSGDSPLAAFAGFADNLGTDIPIVNAALGKKIGSLLPKALCSAGVCDGILPGCPGQTSHPLVVPKVEFKYNRPFRWNNYTQEQLKTAVAFGTALVPELVRVTSIVVTSILHDKISTTLSPWENRFNRNSGSNRGSVVYVDGKPCRWKATYDCEKKFYYQGTKFEGCSTKDHKGKGWCSVDRTFAGNWRNCVLICPNQGGRRLAEETEVAKEPEETDHAVVQFEPGAVQYPVDEDLIHKLIKRQAFRGVEDGKEATHGELKIVGFRLLREAEDDQADFIPVGSEQKFEMDTRDRPQEKFQLNYHAGLNSKEKAAVQDVLSQARTQAVVASLPIPAIGAAVAAFAVASLAAGVFMWRRRNAQLYLEVDSAAEVAALE